MSSPRPRSQVHKFRLFVAGDTPNSTEALGNLTAICRDHLAERYEIEVIDVFRDPQRALAEGIFMTPALKKLGPPPTRTIIGTLSQANAILQALGLESRRT